MDTKISIYHYNADECFFSDSISLKKSAEYDRQSHVSWINILGISDQKVLQETGEIFNIHSFAVEDIANAIQRAKIEEYDDMLYIVLRMFYIGAKGKIQDQQVSFVLRNNVLLTFRETDTGIFSKTIGERLKAGSGNLRKRGEDYLLYSLLDVIIDNYYFVLEHISDQIEELDHAVLHRPDDRHLMVLQKLKGQILYIRKYILPVRELINNLKRFEIEYFDVASKYFLRDLQDHMQRNVEEIDFQRDQLNSLMDLYYSLQTHKMNTIMKTLTGVSFVLLPLTFLASLYGMNFSVIPRSEDPMGFYEMVAVMVVVAVVLIIFAFRWGWLSVKDFNQDKK